MRGSTVSKEMAAESPVQHLTTADTRATAVQAIQPAFGDPSPPHTTSILRTHWLPTGRWYRTPKQACWSAVLTKPGRFPTKTVKLSVTVPGPEYGRSSGSYKCLPRAAFSKRVMFSRIVHYSTVHT